MIIVGVDPGLYTGMAYWDTRFMDKPSAIEVPYAETGARLFKWLYGVNSRNDVHVACERYVMIGGPKTPQPEALMGMGAVEYVCQGSNASLSWFFPVDTKRVAPDSVLRDLGWFVKTKDGHANDGQRLVLKWYADHCPQDFAELVGL